MVRAWRRLPADLERAWGGGLGGTPGGGTSSPGWRGAGTGRGGSTGASDVPQHARRLPAVLASRSRGCQPLSRIRAIFGVFCAKIHSEEKRLHRVCSPGTAGSPQAARKPCPPKTAVGSRPTPRSRSSRCPRPASAPAPPSQRWPCLARTHPQIISIALSF